MGDLVWSFENGARIAVRVSAVSRAVQPATHEVVRLALADGRSVDVSAGHPTADGRTVGDLGVGDAFDGSTVTSAARIAYTAGHTFDLLPNSASGAYWANGVLLGSTLR